MQTDNYIKQVFSEKERDEILSKGGKIIQTKKDINDLEFWLMLIRPGHFNKQIKNEFNLTF